MKKKLLALLFAVALVILAVPTAFAAEVVDSGTCGDNVTWVLTDDGVLTISGTGTMGDWGSDDVPWYESRASVKTVVIENGVTSIGSDAFRDCGSLTSVTIPDSVFGIGWDAFQGCSSLTSVTIPKSVTSINLCTFQGCSSLTSVTIPDSVTYIGGYAFGGCSSLTSVVIPGSVTRIAYSAFSGCSSLTSVTIPDSVTYIDESVFSGCGSLTNVTIPDSVTSIGYGAFEDCSSLTNVTIPDSVTSIGGSAFRGCSSLTSVTIPESVTSLGERAFPDLQDVYYGGTSDQWSDLDNTVSAERYHYSCTDAENHWTETTTPATCGAAGFTGETCACGYARNQTEIPATGKHSFGEWITVKDPTSSEEGLQERTCACGEKESRIIPAKEPEVTEPAIKVEFEDVADNAWYAEEVAWAVANGITNGTTDTTFSPENLCTRAQVVTFLWREAGEPKTTSDENPFVDVNKDVGGWYYDAVLWAVENGITAGRDATHFAPDDNCLRSEVVMFLWRAAGKPSAALSQNDFADVSSDSWFYDPVLWAVGEGITTGVDDTHFAPDNKCTRAQIVTFLYRYAN